MSRLKEYFSKKTDKEIFTLFQLSCLDDRACRVPFLRHWLLCERVRGTGACAVGANQTVTVTTEGTQSVASSFAAVVRVNACNTSALSITASAAITVTNAALKVIED